jgi:hypothetical protein
LIFFQKGISVLLSKKDCKNITFDQNSIINGRTVELIITDMGIFAEDGQIPW